MTTDTVTHKASADADPRDETGRAHDSRAPGSTHDDTQTRDIFIVCNNSDEMGGVNSWIDHIGRLYTLRGHRVHVIGVAPAATPHDFGAERPYRTSTLYRRHPLPGFGRRTVRTVTNPAKVSRELRRRATMRRAVARLSSLFAEAEPGGVVIVTQVWAMAWVAQADTHGMPVIGMSHESYEATKDSSRYHRVKRLYSGVDLLVLLTQDDADAWTVDGMNNTCAIPNPVPFIATDPSPRTGKVVVTYGRLSFEKGFDMLLEAWHQLAPTRPDWTLRVYGAGPEEQALREQASELGIADRVEFPGRTEDVQAALRESAVFANPSRAEGFPVSLLEAMAMGVPCVAFDCAPGVRAIINDEVDGLLAPPGNVRLFAERLARLMDDQELRDEFGEAALRNVARFSRDAILDRWERLFRMVHR